VVRANSWQNVYRILIPIVEIFWPGE